MKHSLLKPMKQTGKWWLLALLLIITHSSKAQTGSSPAPAGRSIVFKTVLDGAQNQLVANAEAAVEDSVYMDDSLEGKLNLPYPVKNVITFKVNEYSNLYLPAKFTATVNLRITYGPADNSTDEVDQSLTIDYDTAATYTARNSFVFDGAHFVKVKILSITSDVGTGVLSALMLENEMQAQPEYILSCTDDAVKSISSNNPPNTDATDEIRITWPATKGADEYDLEWAYIDSSALANHRYGNPVNRQLVFENNASRVSVKDNAYNVPLLYDNGGVLFFRVRAIQQKGDARIETAWSSGFPNGFGSYNFCGHQRSLNWQSTISYAEDGKRKAVVQYYDGSLRSRQTVTKDNSTNTTLVSESLYDYQGRPVITVLPAPTLNSVIQYSRKFNRAMDGGEYDKDKYDRLDDPADFLTASAPAMSQEYGANKYYAPSEENDETEDGFNRFIPQAKGYAFTETSYTQDNTGRISRQGGVGSTYKLGSNHETKYYYNTAAQEEIDALFGTEVGANTHYFKNMVRDANGQYAVSYLDMHGRTIATALAGQADSADLARLPSDVPFEVTEALSGGDKNTVKDLVMESYKSQPVPVPARYFFRYELTPPVLEKAPCADGQQSCYNVLYDLEVTITDDCNNLLLGGQPFVRTVQIPVDASGACNGSPAPFVDTFSIFLPKGSYEITKRLIISREGLENYRDNLFMSASCKTLDDFIQEQRQLLLSTQCQPTCQSCLDSLGTWEQFRNNYMARAGIKSDTAAYRAEARAAFEGALESCNALCNNESQTDDVRRAMLMDMTAPSGQYADPDHTDDQYSIFFNNGTPNAAPYQRGDIVYLDESGNPDLVYDQFSNSYVKPQQLNANQFAAAFKASWAETLLRFHPEYCRLLEYEKYKASNEWDREFETTDTYALAKARGYLNPTGKISAWPFTLFTPNPQYRDPLANIGNLASQLEDRMFMYKVVKTGNRQSKAYSIWGSATTLVKCSEGNTACIDTYMPPQEAFNESKLCTGDLDMAWRNFRQLYLEVKKKMVADLVKAVNCQPTSGRLTELGKHSHFNDANTALDQNGLGYMNTMTNEEQGKNKGQEELNKYYNDNCQAYALMWRQQLSGCYSQAALDEIIPLMVNVCKEGSDRTHTTGASTVRPGSTYSFQSFQAVLDDYNDRHGITDIVNCNAELITSPKPYNSQPAYGSKTTYTLPEDCECDKLNVLHDEYVAYRKPADSTFSTYLLRTRKIVAAESMLQKLLNACNQPAGGCTYLPEPLPIPAFMQCNVAPACATCRVVDSLYEKFVDTFDETPTIAEPNAAQQKINQLFANYMNNRLGFAKGAWEYLRFRDSCDKSTFSDTTVCVSPSALMKTYSNGSSDVINSIVRTADNGYLLAGSTLATGGGGASFSKETVSTFVSTPLSGRNAYLIKTDNKGVFQWAKIYGGPKEEEFAKITATSDGGYIAIGKTTSGTDTVSKGDIFIVKVDANGNALWSRALAFNTTYGERGNDIVQMNNGGYAFSGGYDYEAGVADWLVGVLNANGKLMWAKRFGSKESDPTINLMANGDTLILSGSIRRNSTDQFYSGVVMKVNRNSGDVVSGNLYHLESDGSYRSNWFGSIFKTPFGYKINVLDAYQFGSSAGNSVVLDIRDNYEVISARKFSRPPANIAGCSFTPTLDGGFMSTQIIATPPQDIYLHKVAADNSLTWSHQLKITGNEQLNAVLQNPDGSYAGAGMHDNKAMLTMPLASGLTGCQDSTVNATFDIVQYTSDPFTPERNEGAIPIDTLFNLGVQSLTVTTDTVGCHDFDSCYTISAGPLLCGNAEEVFSMLPVDTLNNCSDNEMFAITTGTALYKAYRDSLRNSFEQDYINTALKAQELEKFTARYETREYHYTLYYYDQAGNLVKTIPPAGVVVNRTAAWLDAVNAARAEDRQEVPAHTMATQYRYNTLNQVIAQKTPDAGASRFWYDRLGRLAVSQNAKQVADNHYSYTLYDALGRITEVGEITSATAMTDNISRSETALSGWISDAEASRTQITVTTYDVPSVPFENIVWNPTNLRNRVSWTGLYNSAADLEINAASKRAAGTFYSYDILGNVNMLLQDHNLIPSTDQSNRVKKIVYDYDLVSGKVNKVSYQPGYKDQFFHRYSYDAENRLTNVETSTDGIYWENDAYYQYYKHGPLARTVLGQQQVQGVDYAYTLQGWLKGVNSSTLTPEYDMGHDGATGGITARDAYGFALHYFGERDYQAVNTEKRRFADAESAGSMFKPLFNGNISMMSVNLPKVGQPLLYAYGYDVLNRLVKMDAAHNLNTTTNNWEPISLDDYRERVSYDPNGNILTYNRNGDPSTSGFNAGMDSLTYNYIAGTNKLDAITDYADDGQYSNDLKTQDAGNYDYDAIGNLTKDVGAGINQNGIEWTVYGKIKRITKQLPNGGSTTISYDYDPAGNRISKNVDGKVTRYVRDASGNVMSVYVYNDPAINSGHASQIETHLYGSSRLGISTRVTEVESSLTLPTANLGGLESVSNITFARGLKFFELGNHLGNVLATVSDVKKARSEDGSTIDHFDASLVSAQDYYPFGMLEPGRNWNGGGYRYGFNGQEKSEEIQEGGNSYTAQFWEYDPRIGRRWNLDPKPRIGISDYLVLDNNPIINVDPKGDLFFKLFGSTSEQRQAAKAFAQENGGEVRKLLSSKIHVNYNEGYTTYDGDKKVYNVSNRDQYFRSNGRIETGTIIGNYYHDKKVDYWNSHGVDRNGNIYFKPASGRAEYFALESYFVPIPPILKILKTSRTVSFFTVQAEKDAIRLMEGGAPWPLSATRAHLGEGLYAWGSKADAEAYLKVLGAHGAPDLSILEFRISKSTLKGLKSFSVPLEDEAANLWLSKFSSLYGEGLPHGFQYIQRSASMGTEHYFSKEVFPLFNIKKP